MTRGVRLYLVGSVVVLALASCGRSWIPFQEREPWREQAEAQCLKSGSIKEGPGVARIAPIDGPGICGASYPLKVAALGQNTALGFADELRPPASVPTGSFQRYPLPRDVSAPPPAYEPPPRQGATQTYDQPPRYGAPPTYNEPPRYGSPPYGQPYPQAQRMPPVSSAPARSASVAPRYGEPAPAGAPLVLTPSVAGPMDDDDDDDIQPVMRAPAYPPARPGPPYGAPRDYPQRPDYGAPAYPQRPAAAPPPYESNAPRYGQPGRYPQDDELRPRARPLSPSRAAFPPSDPNPPVRLGPARAPVTGAAGPAAIAPPATLACPIVSALDQWVAGAVQPAAMRWFGQPVAEIKQISAYSCRGMNGNPRARISEHAFGNALDIAAFLLADGRTVTVKNGWRGTPEEQGFLRDVAGAACVQFSTVLAPGSNRFHYDHIHVDLMQRSRGRRVCNPAAVPGEVVAARAAQQRSARRGEPAFTGSLASNDRPKVGHVFDDEDLAAREDEDDTLRN
jgi:hypothetical protein